MGDAAAMSIRLLSVALIACFAFPASALAAAGDPVLDNEEKALCRAVNSYRAQNGVPVLKVSVALTKASRWMSADMGRYDYFGHTDSLGRSFSKRISAFGYTGATRSENIAGGVAGGVATFNQWKASSAHRANMLSRTFKVIGLGRGWTANSMMGMYWTANFGNATDRTMAC
jgi:uncharacterized protein YkwD